MIQLALNGNRQEPIVPKSTEAIVESALIAVSQGVSSVHFHPRDKQGAETLKREFVDEQVFQLRRKLGAIPIGITTGAWIEPDLKIRMSHIKSWETLPDFVSINYDEPGFEHITEVISGKGIRIEAGLCNVQSALNFTGNYLQGDFIRILVEPAEQNFECALATVRQIEEILGTAGNKIPLLLHGVDKTCWDLYKTAHVDKHLTRIGFEDTMVLPNGKKAVSNREILEEALLLRKAYL